MTTDPPRLRLERGLDDPLGVALRASLEDVPNREQVAALERRLGIGSANAARLQPLPRRGLGGPRGVRVALLALAATIGAGATVAGYRALQTPASPASAGSAASVERAPTANASPAQRGVERDPQAEAVPVPVPSATHAGVRAIDEGSVRPSSSGVSPGAELPASADLPPVGVDDTVASAAPSEAVQQLAREPESALLGRAQRALGSNPALALSLAERHATDYPSGLLSQEREVIAIQALVALQRVPEARIRAEAFRTRYPGSAHLRRIDRLLAPTPTTNEGGAANTGAAEPSP